MHRKQDHANIHVRSEVKSGKRINKMRPRQDEKLLTFSFSGIRDECRASHLSRTSLWTLASTSAGPSAAAAASEGGAEEEAEGDDGEVLSPPLDQFQEFDEKHLDGRGEESALLHEISVTYARA